MFEYIPSSQFLISRPEAREIGLLVQSGLDLDALMRRGYFKHVIEKVQADVRKQEREHVKTQKIIEAQKLVDQGYSIFKSCSIVGLSQTQGDYHLSEKPKGTFLNRSVLSVDYDSIKRRMRSTRRATCYK